MQNYVLFDKNTVRKTAELQTKHTLRLLMRLFISFCIFAAKDPSKGAM